ncbi:MAG: flagellar hook protein FlgE [Gammaproteobacteria bacterium]|nr:flagellar hook protein FlgE [Gammaproteobacteria bacterium]MDX5375430.1 flagellar hook protein FlgE [Gammaproteobacteria bacterium]
MPFQIALSGLSAASSDLKVTGNNIANASTVGFKESRAEFADVFAVSFGGISNTAIGGGTRLAAVTQQFTQGNVDPTGNGLDIAVNGQGFFVYSNNGVNNYSRNGALQVDRSGYLVDAQNRRLQVYEALDPTGSVFNTGTLSDLQLSTNAGQPAATTAIDATLNLQADDTATGVAGPDIDPTDPNTFNYSTSVTVYDSLGISHTVNMYFQKTASNTWDVRAQLNSPGGVTTDLPIGGNQESVVTFNPDGSINTGGLVDFDVVNLAGITGADPLDLELDLGNSTQYGAGYNVSGLVQDGYTTGRLSSIDIDEEGVVFARFTNGQAEALGKVALANFANPQGLQQLGENSWGETFAAGVPQLGEAGSASFGLIQSGGLETSNVDIAQQLVKLITAQRNYQANAQVISTADTVTQTIINIR